MQASKFKQEYGFDLMSESAVTNSRFSWTHGDEKPQNKQSVGSIVSRSSVTTKASSTVFDRSSILSTLEMQTDRFKSSFVGLE